MEYILGLIAGAFLTFFVFALCSLGEPSAMDVYQGKTTLEYKVVDGVKVDSVVVFKTSVR